MATKKVQIEFFHDVICSFCFPMSYRMRQLQEAMPDLEIIHRSFALVSQPSDFDRMFGSRERAKDEIITHWAQANQQDELRRFNSAGMQAANFPFPISMPGLHAAKATWFVGGEAAYWDAFDALQAAFFTHNQNIEQDDAIYAAIRGTDIDFDEWKKHYESDEVKAAVQADFAKARQYGLRGVPALVINQSQIIPGALPLEKLKQIITEVRNQMPDEDTIVGMCTPEGCL